MQKVVQPGEIQNKGDVILSLAAFFQTVVLMLQELLLDASLVSHESSRIVSIILSALPMTIAIYYIIRRRLILFIITYTLIFALILITLGFSGFSKPYLTTESFYLLFINVPCFLCLASIENTNTLKFVVLKLSYIIFILGLVYFVLVISGFIIFSRYNMSFSYDMLLPALIFVNQKKLNFTIYYILICIMMLLLGSRGAFIISLLYGLWLLFFDSRRNRYIILVVFLILLMTPFLIPILNLFSDKIEITSRTLNMIMEGNIADFSTRINLYKTTWSSILEQPFVGHGLYSDRIILDGSYSHNIFLELFHNFGLIIGSALIAILLLKVMRVYYLSDRNQKKLLILFLFYGFVPLLVSQSYLNYAPFGLFIGSLIHLSYRYDHSNPKVVPSQGLNKIIP